MNVIVKEITVRDYLTKSNLPASDYVINPYVGCPHACKYCYASFMKRFTGHTEEWGSFLDIKKCDKTVSKKKLEGKSLFLSSVTDCYNPYEKKYQITRSILEQLVDIDCEITISTKSNLILRDVDLLKKMPHLKVAISLNTLNESFRKDMDNGSTVDERIETLRQLHKAGLHTVLFMSPIFPHLTEWDKIIDKTKAFVKEYWFENLNLRGGYKTAILKYIAEIHPEIYPEYDKIYLQKDDSYCSELAELLETYCKKEGISYTNYFYHKELVQDKMRMKKVVK